MPDLSYTPSGEVKEGFKVDVKANDLCPRYIACYVSDVKSEKHLSG